MRLSTGRLVKKYIEYGVTRYELVKWFEAGSLTGRKTEGGHLKIEEESLKSLLGITEEGQ